MASTEHPLAEQYTLVCQHEGCNGVRIIKQIGSAGLKVGTLVSHTSEDPDYGRCLRCQRYTMKVTSAPPPPLPIKPVGFTKIPKQ